MENLRKIILFFFQNLRQSFLLRDDETLNRLATISAKADGASGAVSDGKNNFVFRRIEEKVSNLRRSDDGQVN